LFGKFLPIVLGVLTMTISVPELSNRAVVAVPRSDRALGGTSSYSFPASSGLYRNFFKRALDILAVLLTAPVVVPIVAILALFVAKEGGRPFYSQFRVGKNGRPFRMWKLRTMVVDADARMNAYLDANPEARAEWDRNQKLRVDPRITQFGQILRKSSLDELPQLWNVFIGAMSLVGPRPMMVNQQSLYPGKAYFLVRPGVTGLWQTTDRNQTSFEARADFDTVYEEGLSLQSDLRIMLKTVGVVVKGTGY
jgi:exopolysaccharide production protein ExoY